MDCSTSEVYYDDTAVLSHITPLSLLPPQVTKPDQVTALTSSQEEQLQRDIDIPDTFHRKMTVHSILYKLHYFLIDGKRVIINKRERQRGSTVRRAPVSFYGQKRQI